MVSVGSVYSTGLNYDSEPLVRPGGLGRVGHSVVGGGGWRGHPGSSTSGSLRVRCVGHYCIFLL